MWSLREVRLVTRQDRCRHNRKVSSSHTQPDLVTKVLDEPRSAFPCFLPPFAEVGSYISQVGFELTD